MREYFTLGIVLDREPRNELDETITAYTKELGKVRAFTKSSRKITSKLSAHLHPGRHAKLRFVERNKLHLVDALSSPSHPNLQELLPFIHFINKITPYGDPDLGLWYMVEEITAGGHFDSSVYHHLLEKLGYATEEASCYHCQAKGSSFFSLPDAVLVCGRCRARLSLKPDELVFLEQS